MIDLKSYIRISESKTKKTYVCFDEIEPEKAYHEFIMNSLQMDGLSDSVIVVDFSDDQNIYVQKLKDYFTTNGITPTKWVDNYLSNKIDSFDSSNYVLKIDWSGELHKDPKVDDISVVYLNHNFDIDRFAKI